MMTSRSCVEYDSLTRMVEDRCYASDIRKVRAAGDWVVSDDNVTWSKLAQVLLVLVHDRLLH